MAKPALHDGRQDRSGYGLDVDEAFAGTVLDRSRWLPWYQPHRSSRAAADQ
jgi:hypothetical protein